jgi:hypothetical protein
MNFEDLDNYYLENLSEDTDIEYCLTLMDSSSISPEWKLYLRAELETFEVMEFRLKEIKSVLMDSQIDRINSGLNYSATDIVKKLNREICKVKR